MKPNAKIELTWVENGFRIDWTQEIAQENKTKMD